MATAATEKPQVMAALELATKAQKAQTAVLNAVKANKVSLEKALDDPAIRNIPIERLLRALPSSRFKSDRRNNPAAGRNAAAILCRARITPSRPVGSIRDVTVRAVLLNVAHEVTGSCAWVFTSDPAPVLVKREWKGQKGQTEQQAAAFEKSLAIRRRRKEIKEHLRAREMSLEEALEDPAAETWQIGQIVVNLRRANSDGTARKSTWSTQIHRTLARIGLPETAKAGQLTAYDRRLLLLAFADEGFFAVRQALVAA